MLLRKVKKHGQANITYTGELGETRVIVVFENEAKPTEGDIKVTNGKVVTKGDMSYYYVRDYVEVPR